MNIFKNIFRKSKANIIECDMVHKLGEMNKNNRIYKADGIEIPDKVEPVEIKKFIDDDEYGGYSSAIECLIQKFNIKDNSTGFFTYICKYSKVLPKDIIEKYDSMMNWDIISERNDLNSDFIRYYKDKVNWKIISQHQKLSEYFIKEFQDRVDWDNITMFQNLSECFMDDFKSKINWNIAKDYQSFSESYIRKVCSGDDKLMDLASVINRNNDFSSEFFNDFKNDISWDHIHSHVYDRIYDNGDYILSEDFICELIESGKVHNDTSMWRALSDADRWSLDFIRKYKDKIDWTIFTHRKCFSMCPYLSNEEEIQNFYNFIDEFHDYIDWDKLVWYRHEIISLEFLSKYFDKVPFDDLIRYDDMKNIITYLCTGRSNCV